MTQGELAKLVGVRRETIVHLENGKYNPSLKLAMDIAHVFSATWKNCFLSQRIQNKSLFISESFLLLLRRYEGTAHLPRTESFYWKHEFSAIFSFIQSHYADMTLAETAKHFHYSERQINRIVKSCTGDTYAHLVLRLRMEHAASLFNAGAEIDLTAEASGYSTLPSFYRAFTAYYECTPGEYRKKKDAEMT